MPYQMYVRPFVTALVLAAALLFVAVSHAQAQSCMEVRGSYTERYTTTPPECVSPVDSCSIGQLKGAIRGTWFAVSTSMVESMDTPETGVVLFTGSNTLQVSVRGLEGELMIKDAASVDLRYGNVANIAFILGGTGELEGATGVLRTTGVLDEGGLTGHGRYEGSVCVP